VESSVYDDRQFELDAIGRSKPVEAGKSIRNMLRATKTSDRPSCGVIIRYCQNGMLGGSVCVRALNKVNNNTFTFH